MEGAYQNKIDDLTDLEVYRYENIFKVYETKNLTVSGENNFFIYKGKYL